MSTPTGVGIFEATVLFGRYPGDAAPGPSTAGELAAAQTSLHLGGLPPPKPLVGPDGRRAGLGGRQVGAWRML